jgi:hypothetical protein
MDGRGSTQLRFFGDGDDMDNGELSVTVPYNDGNDDDDVCTQQLKPVTGYNKMMKKMRFVGSSLARSVLLLIITTTLTNAETIPPFQTGVPGSGYGCDRKCGGDAAAGDVNYVIRASLHTYPLYLPPPIIPAAGNSEHDSNPGGGLNVSMFTRTFEGVAEER